MKFERFKFYIDFSASILIAFLAFYLASILSFILECCVVSIIAFCWGILILCSHRFFGDICLQ